MINSNTRVKPRMPRKGINWVFRKSLVARDQCAKTPDELKSLLEEEYGKFDFDPCPTDNSFDGLACEWGENNYVNPPYKDLKQWYAKAVEQWDEGTRQIVFLSPIRVHTNYFINTIMPLIEEKSVTCWVIPGGVRFTGYKWKAPFGLMYLVFPRFPRLNT